MNKQKLDQQIKEMLKEDGDKKDVVKKDMKYIKIVGLLSIISWAIYVFTFNALFGFFSIILLIMAIGWAIIIVLKYIHRDIIEKLEALK